MMRKDNNAATVDELIETGNANGKEVLITEQELTKRMTELGIPTTEEIARKIEELSK